MYDIILFFLIFSGVSDLNFHEYFILKPNHYYNLRTNNLQVQPKFNFSFKINQISNCFFTRSCQYWNALPQNIVESRTVPEFKRKLNEFDLCCFVK